MINLTVVIDNEEAIRKFRELQQTAKTVTSNVVTDADRMDIAMRRFAATIGTVSFVEFVRQLAITRGEFQQLEVAFTTLLQSKEKADALMAEMVELAAKTPFDLQGVADGARQLLAYGFSAEDITDTLTRLGNVAAGLGLPLERLTYLYGTTAVQGRLYARDMLQFTSSGIPMLQEMAQMYGKTTEEINAMVTAGKIGFEDVKKVIESMTNEGGQFYNLMQDQSKTISGLISNLGDAIDSMFNDMGKSNEGVITGVLKGTISLVENYQKVLDILIPLVAAYGTYKAGLIAAAAAQKVQVTIEATKAILEKTKMLTRATQAQILFNKAVKANPYVLAASALIGLITAISTFSKKAKSTADIVEDLNSVTSKYTSKANSISDLADTYEVLATKVSRTKSENDQLAETMNKLADAVPSAISQFDEYGRVLGINISKVREFSEAQKEALKIDVTSQIGTAKTRVSEIDKELAGLQKIYQDKYYYRNKTDNVGGQLVVFQDLEKVPYSEEQIINAAKKANELYAERQQLIDAITKGEKILEGINPKNQQGSETSGPIVSAADNIKSAQQAYTAAVKAWKSAVKGGDDVKVVNEKKEAVETAKKALDEARKLAGVDQNTVNEAEKKQKELSDIIISNDLALQQSRIDVMKDGKQKELAIIDQSTKEKLNKLEEDKEKLKKAQNGSLTEYQTTDFNERESNIKQKRVDDRAAVELKYAKKLDEVYKQITSDTLSEEDRRINGIKEKYEEFRRWVQDALDKGDITKEQATDLGIKIDQAEIASTLNTIVEEYSSANDKIAKIRKEAENARKAAKAGGREDLIPQIDKSETEKIGKIRVDELMKTDDWINLFQNLDALSSREILRIIDNINNIIKDADLDPINLKAVTDKLNEATETAIRKNPFTTVSKGFKEYKLAQEAAIKLQQKYNDTQKESDKIAADQASINAIKKKNLAWQGVVDTMGEVSQVLGSFSDLLSQFGIESEELNGIVKSLNAFSSIDVTRPVTIITGVIGGISSLIGGIFNGKDKRAEKRIKTLQDQVDALQKSYDALGDAIDKAYSTDASELIDQQNDKLKQQNTLLEKQIREEQSKKKTDNDRIKEWRDQIEENNKLIEDNAEKAKDAIFGEDIKSAIDDFAEAYTNAWTSGEDKAKSVRDEVKTMMKNMVTESIKAAMQSSQQIEAIREKLKEFYADNILTSWEQDYIYKMADALQQELDSKYGWADSIFKDDSSTSQSASSNGFQTMSQDTATELNGRFTALQGYTAEIRDILRDSATQDDNRINEIINIRDIAIQMNNHLGVIEKHTVSITSIDEKMGKLVKIINEKL